MLSPTIVFLIVLGISFLLATLENGAISFMGADSDGETIIGRRISKIVVFMITFILGFMMYFPFCFHLPGFFGEIWDIIVLTFATAFFIWSLLAPIVQRSLHEFIDFEIYWKKKMKKKKAKLLRKSNQ